MRPFDRARQKVGDVTEQPLNAEGVRPAKEKPRPERGLFHDDYPSRDAELAKET